MIDAVVFEEFFDNCTLNSRRRALWVSIRPEREVQVRVGKIKLEFANVYEINTLILVLFFSRFVKIMKEFKYLN